MAESTRKNPVKMAEELLIPDAGGKSPENATDAPFRLVGKLLATLLPTVRA